MLRYEGRALLLHSAFDEEVDEYEPTYSVYALPESAEAALVDGSWKFMEEPGLTLLGEVAVRDVRFDSSRRKLLDAQVLAELVIK